MTLFVVLLAVLKFALFPGMSWWLVFSPWIIAATFFFCTLFAALVLHLFISLSDR